jgi:molybdenum cofactor cytidylyltransferase
MGLKVTAVLLAAGRSQRMGTPKQLLKIEGKPFIRHCLDALVTSGIADIVVVLGAFQEKIEPVITDLPVRIVSNPAMESEMAESVRLGLDAVDDQSSGILIHLCDHPLVTAETCEKLLNAHLSDPFKIVIPTYEARRGHPTLFPTSLIRAILSGGNLKDIIRANSESVESVSVDDQGTIWDIDSLDDYNRLLAKA